MVTQLPGGVLARKFGGATMLGLSVGTCGALNLLTPLAARAHIGVLIALRIAIGMAEVKNTNFSFSDEIGAVLETMICFYLYVF